MAEQARPVTALPRARPGLMLIGVICACSQPAPRAPREVGPDPATTTAATKLADAGVDPARAAAELIASSKAASDEGDLYRALELAEMALATHPTRTSRLAVATTLADLGLDARAKDAYRALATAGDAADRDLASAAIAELDKRPSPTRTPSAKEQERALMLYRDGVNLRLRGDYPNSIRQLRRSYALWPHPLTIVQIGTTHTSAGDPRQARRANARALAMAELTRATSAAPHLRRGHAALITALAFHPDRRRIFSTSHDGMIGVWDRRSGRLVKELRGPDNMIGDLAISGDGKLLASAGNRNLRIWNLAASDERPRQFADQMGPVTSVALSSDGALLASGGILGAIEIWDVTTMRRRHQLPAARMAQARVALSPDSAHVAFARDRQIGMVDTANAKLVTIATSARATMAIAYSNDGALLAWGGIGGTAVVWSVADKRRVAELAHGDTINALAFSPDDSVLAVASMSTGPVTLWRLADKSPIRSLANPDNSQACLAFSPDGATLAIAGTDTMIRLRDLATGELTNTMGGYGSLVNDLAFSADGRRLAVITGGTEDRSVKVWSLRETVGVRLLSGHYRQVRDVAFSHSHVASADISGVRLWNLTAPDDSLPLTGKLGEGRRVAFSSDGALLAVAGKALALWDVGADKPGHILAAVDDSRFVTFAPGRLVSSGRSGDIKQWELASGQLIRTIAPLQKRLISAIAVHPDGKVIVRAVGSQMELFDAASGTLTETLDVAAHMAITSLDFSADGALLAVGTYDRQLLIWDFARRKQLHLLSGHSDTIAAARFNPAGGRLLASASWDKTVKLWDAGAGQLVATLVATERGEWLVYGADGRVDGSAATAVLHGASDFVFWQVGDIQLPGFVAWDRYRTPNLLAELLTELDE